MNRRKFLKTVTKLTYIGAATGLYTWQIEPHWLEFVKMDLPIANLPPHLVGKTLMQISDIHLGRRVDRAFIEKSFEKARELEPDFVAYTGDFISYDKGVVEFSDLETVFANPVLGKLGTLGVLGNHDYGKNWSQPEVAEKVVQILEKSGLTILRNTQKTLEGLNFIGFDDYWGTNFFPKEATKNHDPLLANIVLCHNPDAADKPVWNGYKGWILSGHTHGGQCKPPFLDPLIVPCKNKKYTAGVVELANGRRLYINRALGHLWQVRFNVRPEITLFSLKNL